MTNIEHKTCVDCEHYQAGKCPRLTSGTPSAGTPICEKFTKEEK